MVPWGSTLSVPTLAMKYFRKKKQATTLSVQDNGFNIIYTAWMCKVASNQATECIDWAGSSFNREIWLF